ncbi:MAG: type I methionyl aminopeptidase [Chloroflexota bacterium]
MSVTLKSDRERDIMRQAGRIVADSLQELQRAVCPGMTTRELDEIAERSIRRSGGDPAFPYINDFPGTACISVNDEVVHGIPGKRVLLEGDLVKIDIGAIFEGYHGDAAITVPVGEVDSQALRLLNVTEECLARGIAAAQPSGFLRDIGAAIQGFAESEGFSVIRQYVGHGIGRILHEEPNVYHYKQTTRGMKLRPGMAMTIEPMINQGSFDTFVRPDGWTVVTRDGKLSAQFEHSIFIGEDGPEILTMPSDGKAWSIPFQSTNSVQ